MDSIVEQSLLEDGLAICRTLDIRLQAHLEMTGQAISGEVYDEYRTLVQYTDEQLKSLRNELTKLYNESTVM